MIFGLCGVFMFIPSSKANRISKSRQKLGNTYKAPPAPELQSLKRSRLVQDGVFSDPSSVGECMVYIFAPTPAESFASQYISEISLPRSYVPQNQNWKTLVLFAPDPSSAGWTLLAKVWLAKCIEKKAVKPITNMAVTMGFAGSTKEMQKIWDSISPEIQTQAENMLSINRGIAKRFGGSRRFYFDGAGHAYEIPSSIGAYEFMSDYREANPNHRVAE